jgi:hypothetical protein
MKENTLALPERWCHILESHCEEGHVTQHSWIKCSMLAALVCAASGLASANTSDVSLATSVEVPSGASLDVFFPFPDLSLMGGDLPTQIFMAAIGPVPSEPLSSYKFTSRLISSDGDTTITLPSTQGGPTTACLDFPSCTQHFPAILLVFSYSDGPGLGILSSNGTAGQPGGELVITNIGPSLEIGGIFPGTTLSGLLGVTLGNSHGGAETFSTVLFVPSPEPAPFSLCLVGFSVLAIVAIRRRLS